MAKRILGLVAAAVLLLCCMGVLAEGETWTCPNCGTENTDRFCSHCGTQRPEGEDAAAGEGKVRLDLKVVFQKNAILSQYDVRLLIDDEWVTTIRHGTEYAGTVYVAPGRHYITFRQESSSSPAEGSTVVNVTGPTLYQCEIFAKWNTVQISGERATAISESDAAPGETSAIPVDGSLALSVHVEFKKNVMFSQYDVDVYLDDTFIASLPHGRNFDGILLVSEGKHMLTFYKAGDRKVRGTISFEVKGDAALLCEIETQSKKVDIMAWRMIN